MIRPDYLEVMCMGGKPGIAFFDMDHTIIGIDCSVSWKLAIKFFIKGAKYLSQQLQWVGVIF